MKKNLLLVVFVSIFILLISGCFTSNSKDTKDVTLTFAIWDRGQEAGMNAIAKAFTEKNPNIKIDVQVTGWDEYWTKLEAAATGGSLPDIFWMHATQFYKYSMNDMLMDIGNKLDKKIFDNFPKDLVDLYRYNGNLYGIPKDFDTIGVFYNKEIFDKAGVPYPDGSWDWDEYLEVAKKLTGNGMFGIAAPLDPQQGYWNPIYQNGGYVISEDRKKSGYDLKATQEAVEWWVNLSLKEKVSPLQIQFEENGPFERFMSGQIAMIQLGSWMVSPITQNKEMANKIDVTYLPRGKKQASLYNGLAYSASARTRNPEAVEKFLEFLASKEANELQAKYAAAIPAYIGTSQAWVEHNKNMNLQIFVDQLKYGIIFPNSVKGYQWRAYENELFSPVFAGRRSVEEATIEYARRMNSILATE